MIIESGKAFGIEAIDCVNTTAAQSFNRGNVMGLWELVSILSIISGVFKLKQHPNYVLQKATVAQYTYRNCGLS